MFPLGRLEWLLLLLCAKLVVLLMVVLELLNLGDEEGETLDEKMILLIELTDGLFLPEGDGFLEFVSDFVYELKEERKTNEAREGCVSISLRICCMLFMEFFMRIPGDNAAEFSSHFVDFLSFN